MQHLNESICLYLSTSRQKKLFLRNVRLSRIWNKGCPIKMSHISTVYQEIQFLPGVKSKEKLLSWQEKGRPNSKRKKLSAGEFEDLDKDVYSWFVAKRSQQIPIDGVLLNEKAPIFRHDLAFRIQGIWLLAQ